MDLYLSALLGKGSWFLASGLGGGWRVLTGWRIFRLTGSR